MANINFSKNEGETLRHDEWNALGEEFRRLENKIEDSKGTKINFPNDSKKFLNGEGEFSVPTLKTINVDSEVTVVDDAEDAIVTKSETDNEIRLNFSLPKGAKGDTGKVYVPTVDESGNLEWSLQDNPQGIDSTNIKGPQGERGIGLNVSKSKDGKQTTVVITTDETNPTTLETLQINDGTDGHNPCLGRFKALPNPMPSAQDGDYIYVDTIEGGEVTTRIHHYVNNSWDTTGNVVDVSNLSFVSGQDVLDVAIKDVDGKEDNDSLSVLSADAGTQLRNADINLWTKIIENTIEEDCIELFNSTKLINGNIGASSLEFTDNENASYKIIPISGVSIIHIAANASNPARLFFLKTWEGHKVGESAPLVDFNNCYIPIAANDEADIPVVSDAKFLCVMCTDSAGNDVAPISLKFTGNKVVDITQKNLTLSPAKKPYVRPTGDNKNEWHGAVSYNRAITKAESNTGLCGSILRVTAKEDNSAYVAVLAEESGSGRANFAGAYGGAASYGGTVTVHRGTTVDLYIPDDTVEVMFYFGYGDVDTYAPAMVKQIRYNPISEEDEFTNKLSEHIDTTLPEEPDDTRVPSTKLTTNLIQDAVAVYENITIKEGTERFIGFADDITTTRQNKWFKTSSVINKSWLMPVESGDVYKVTAQDDYKTGITFLTNNQKQNDNTVPDWATGYSSVVSILAGESKIFTVPNDAVVMYVFTASGLGSPNSRGAAPAKIEKLNTVQETIDDLRLGIETINEELTPHTGILDLFPDSVMLPKFKQLRDNDYAHDTNPIADCFTFAQISDCHGGSGTTGAAVNATSHANWLRFVTFVKHWYEKGYLDDVVDTGDMVAQKQSNKINEWRYDDDNFTLKIKICIGNHDIAVAGSTGKESSEGAAPQGINLPAYNKFIAPCVETWSEEGVIFPTNAETQGKCYYYKDYDRTSGSRNVTLRAIYLDFMGWGKNTNTGETAAAADAQETWLESVLEDAITNGYMVCIFIHFAPLGVKKINCSFSSASANSLNDQNDYNSNIYKLASVVYHFQEQGGMFVGYFVGHVHRTFIGQLTGNVTNSNNETISLDNAQYQQLVFATDNALMDLSADDSAHDGLRSPNSPSHDSFWVIAINTSGNVKIMKVGFNLNKYMQKRDTIMIRTGSYEVFDETKTNYTKGTVVAKDSLLWKIINPVVVPSYTDWLLTGKIKYVRQNNDETTYQEFNSATIYTANDIVTKDGELWKLTVPYVVSAHTDWTASDKEPYLRIISE